MSGFDQATYDLGNCQLEMPSQDTVETIANAFVSMEPWKTLGTDHNRLIGHFLKNPEDACRKVITASNKAVGMVCVKQNWLVGPYLEFLGLLPQAQGDGVGRTIMNWLEDEAVKAKARNVFLCVSDFNVDAISFYQTCGFEKCAHLDGLVVDNHGEFLMRKRLS